MVGKTLGHYEILEPLGAGGMGEVYRARDTKLDRDVAIKVLSEGFAADADRLARFDREAKLLAAVNHTSIATIHGLEDVEGVRFIAMELVDGETLAERVRHAGRFEVGETLTIARQIAEALETAHERGIVHRDLKPANVKVAANGTVKVLDFGLATAIPGVHGDGSLSLSHSPTASVGPTAAGVLLGTAPYMSPEQASGRAVDTRTDIWSFGCLLFEMLTGQRPFRGENLAETLASILKEEPDWTLLPPETPLLFAASLRRCLRKDPDRRIHHISDLRIEIEDALDSLAERPSSAADAGGTETAGGGVVGTAASGRGRTRSIVIPWAIAALSLAVAAAAWWGGSAPTEAPLESVPALFEVELPAGVLPVGCCNNQLELSPDGRYLAIAAGEPGTSRIYLRPVGSTDITVLPGTEGASRPSFSPQSDWIAFTTRAAIQKVPLNGQDPIVLCSCFAEMVAWGEDGWIYFTTGGGVSRVSADGGAPEMVTDFPGVLSDRPLLPGGRGMLAAGPGGSFGVVTEGGDFREMGQGGGVKLVGTNRITFARGGALFAARFDLDRLELTSAPVRVLESVAVDLTGAPNFTFSPTGTMAYLPAGDLGAGRSLVWVDPQGGVEPAFPERRSFQNPSISPDGRFVAVEVLREDANGVEVWVLDLEQQTGNRLNNEGTAIYPLWGPEPGRVTYSLTAPSPAVFRGVSQPADGSEPPNTFLTDQHTVHPMAWADDGATLFFRRNEPDDRSLYRVSIESGEPSAAPVAVAAPGFHEYSLALSSDGRWMAYVSNRSGSAEVYVKSVDDPGAGMRISRRGGTQPVWSRQGSRLFFRRPGEMIAVDIQTEPELTAGEREVVFADIYDTPNVLHAGYDVAADGRFLMVAHDVEGAAIRIKVVVNWFEELERLLGGDASR